MWLRACLLPVVASTALACGGVVAGQSAPADAASPADASLPPDAQVRPAADGAASVDAEVFDARDPIGCSGGGTITYDKSCASDTDCVVVTVYLGCCHGAALGCNAHDASNLADAGASCAVLDPCDCAGDVVTADDGRVSRSPGHTDVIVACTGGLCLSRVR